MSVHSLRGSTVSELLDKLERMLANGELASLTVVYESPERQVLTAWSDQDSGDLAFAALKLLRDVMAENMEDT